MIRVVQTGPFATIQDLGRNTAIAEGIGPSGAMDRLSLRRGNRLVGNPDSAAGIEFTGAPLKIEIGRDALIAVTGADGVLTRNVTPLPSDWAEPVCEGDLIEALPSPSGMWRYVAISGGLDVPEILGSRSTDLKNGFGGVEAGRALRQGDLLPLGFEDPEMDTWRQMVRHWGGIGAKAPDTSSAAPAIRIMVAREYDAFTSKAQAEVWTADWQVGPKSNRQGYRMAGPVLRTEPPLSLLSYGLIPGTIQVPQAGQPIVQLAEANTCGGYPRLGVVIEADLGRLAQVRPGQSLRFRRVSRNEAFSAMKAERAALNRIHSVPEAFAC